MSERRRIPMAVQVLAAVALAVPVGLLLGVDGSRAESLPSGVRTLLAGLLHVLQLLPRLALKAMAAVGAPLVLLAIVTALTAHDVSGRRGLRMMGWYALNTAVAISIGLGLAWLVRPGEGASFEPIAAGPPSLAQVLVPARPPSALPARMEFRDLVLDLVPQSLGDALARNHIAQIAVTALAAGIALALLRRRETVPGPVASLISAIGVLFEVAARVLGWILAVVPFAVFGLVATAIAYSGFALFIGLGKLIAVVLIGLALQVGWDLGLLAWRARIGPLRFLRAAADALSVAFSTSSTTATLPRTLEALEGRLGVSSGSSRLAACVGTNFNNDGTALYQAASVLFFAQAAGMDLGVVGSIALALTTVVAAFGAGGIPSGSFITLPLTFSMLGIPAGGLPLLFTVDWFLDRCRTVANVTGDMTVAALIDREAEVPGSA
jgi:DAACS family dicarboxylate/amino acid:cation (Na+ or H+) symporter